MERQKQEALDSPQAHHRTHSYRRWHDQRQRQDLVEELVQDQQGFALQGRSDGFDVSSLQQSQGGEFENFK
jgi:hypothetical protein